MRKVLSICLLAEYVQESTNIVSTLYRLISSDISPIIAIIANY